MAPRLVALGLACVLGASSGCKPARGTQVPVESSASDPAYAERFPAEIASARENFDGVEAAGTKIVEGFDAHGQKMAKADPAVVGPILERAEAAGRSEEYVTRVERIEVANAFFVAEKDTLAAKVGGAVDYTAKKQGCTTGGGGAAGPAMTKAVETQMQKRLRERNAAHRQIEADAKRLGVPRADVEEMVDDVSYASYLVHIGIKRAEDRLQLLREQAYEVGQTLDSQKNVEAKKQLDEEIQKLDAQIAEIQKRETALDDAYRAAFEKLKTQVGSAAAPPTK